MYLGIQKSKESKLSSFKQNKNDYFGDSYGYEGSYIIEKKH